MINPVRSDDATTLRSMADRALNIYHSDYQQNVMMLNLRGMPRLLYALLDEDVISAAVSDYLDAIRTSSGESRGCDQPEHDNQPQVVASTLPAQAGDAGDHLGTDSQCKLVPSIDTSAQADAISHCEADNQQEDADRALTPAPPAGDAHYQCDNHNGFGIPTTLPDDDGQLSRGNQTSIAVVAGSPTRRPGHCTPDNPIKGARPVSPPPIRRPPTVFGDKLFAAAVSHRLDREVTIRTDGKGKAETLQMADCRHYHLEQAAQASSIDAYYYAAVAAAMREKNATSLRVGQALSEKECEALEVVARRQWHIARTQGGLQRVQIDLTKPSDYRDAV